ncbi:tyrosine-tRNA ligase [Thamnocephalis sphaerospora]|uniref:Tyrosine--tRNA ligase n=1 Tax=Thamnocephalis sphaerospora TaxID=78915 RepID=A0A4P9XLM6_9FUNG|nr:tyrosine-tRNA ligase [Thamnocephalis sphaerospora]|eukprot:RKP06170.1 tyrosine-tRNA ligase [Thamnocephalis sphaerospora]
MFLASRQSRFLRVALRLRTIPGTSTRAFSATVPTSKNVLADLRERGLVAQVTSPGVEALVERPTTVYLGVDPTAESMHVGNLVSLLSLLHFYVRGHSVIALVGGATGSIGDPSGRSTERQVLSEDRMQRNLTGIRTQMHQLFERGAQLARKRGVEDILTDQGNTADRLRVLNNYDWFGSMSALAFLGHVGRHARVGAMLARESVKARLTSPQGISFTEFSYQLLQAYDFYHLHREHKCRIQLGGSDQWGNITAGIDLIGRMASEKRTAAVANASEEARPAAFGVTIPLLTTSTGEKFGKSAGNAVWLDAHMTSYYDFYQFFMRVNDDDVERYLHIFTFLNSAEIEAIMCEHKEQPEKRYAQSRLAAETTELVHGEHGLYRAQIATRVLFGSPQQDLCASDLLAAFEHDPRLVRLSADKALGVRLDRLAHAAGACASRSEATKLLKAGGFYLNHQRITDGSRLLAANDLIDGAVCVLRTGKTNYRIVHVEGGVASP